MGLEQSSAQHYREVVDKFVDPIVDYEMTTRDYVVRPSADGDSGPITLTLPSVTEAKGRFYSIVCRNADGTNTVTIQDCDDSECWLADIVLDGKCDRALLYSDGLCWHPLGGDPGEWPGFITAAPAGTSEAPTTAAPTTTLTTATPTTEPVSTTTAPTTTAPTTVAGTTLAPTTGV